MVNPYSLTALFGDDGREQKDGTEVTKTEVSEPRKPLESKPCTPDGSLDPSGLPDFAEMDWLDQLDEAVSQALATYLLTYLPTYLPTYNRKP